MVALALTLMFLLAAAPYSGAEAETPWNRKLPFEQAVISYAVQGAETGTETLYVRDWGRERVSSHTTASTVQGRDAASNTVEITTPNWIYTYDLDSKTGEKAVNPVRFLIQAFLSLPLEERPIVAARADIMGIPTIPDPETVTEPNTDRILDFPCDRTRSTETVVYTLHGTDLVLRTEGIIMGRPYSMTATAIDLGQVPDHVFRHPESIWPRLIPESEAMAREMADQIIQSLRPGSGAKAD